MAGPRRKFVVDAVRRTEEVIPDLCAVLFVLPNGAEIRVDHSHPQDGGDLLSIRVQNGSLRVVPRADNAICVEVPNPTNVRKGWR